MAKDDDTSEPRERPPPPAPRRGTNGRFLPSPDGPKKTRKPRQAKNAGRKPNRGPANPIVDQTGWREKLRTKQIKFDDPAKDVYLEVFAATGLKWRAADAAGVSCQTVNVHIKNDPEFAQAVDEAWGAYRDRRIEKAMDLAFEGVEVKKYNKDGELIEERRDYPIQLIAMELRRVEPGFRDKQHIDVTQRRGVMVRPAPISDEEWEAEQERLNATERQEPPASILDLDPSEYSEQ